MNIGIDIGGSHVGVGLVGSSGKIINKKEVDITEKDKKNIEKMITNTIINFIKIILKEQDVESKEIGYVGIASPGTIENNCIYNVVNLGLEKLDIAKSIKKEFNLEVKIKNDAKCAGIAESMYGSTKFAQDNIYLCLGTGIGGAAFLNNKLVEPRYKSGMEFGHMIIDKEGRECKCGSKGCFETYCSMKVLKREMIETLELNENDTGANIVNETRKHIDDLRVQPLIKEYVEYLAIGISNLINIFEPEVVCIGGSFVFIGDLIIPKLKKEIQDKKLLFNPRKDVNIVLATLSNDAGIIGAASLL